MARGAENHGNDVLYAFGDEVAYLIIRPDEALFAHMGEEPKQRPPEPPNVGDDERLFVTAELDPGELLGELLERADPARQRDECVGLLEHEALALVHVGDDAKLRQPLERDFALAEEIRNDSADFAACVER